MPSVTAVKDWLRCPGQPAYFVDGHGELSDGKVILTITHTPHLVLGTEFDALNELIKVQTRIFKQLCQMASELYII